MYIYRDKKTLSKITIGTNGFKIVDTINGKKTCQTNVEFNKIKQIRRTSDWYGGFFVKKYYILAIECSTDTKNQLKSMHSI